MLKIAAFVFNLLIWAYILNVGFGFFRLSEGVVNFGSVFYWLIVPFAAVLFCIVDILASFFVKKYGENSPIQFIVLALIPVYFVSFGFAAWTPKG